MSYFNQSWVSEEARSYWQPRIKALSEFWVRMERISVLRDLRQLAIQHVNSYQIQALQEYCILCALRYIDLRFDGKTHRVAIYKEGQVDPLSLLKLNDIEIGRLLGYPVCCVEKFNVTWNIYGHKDTMIDMFEWPVNEVYVQECPSSNILLRDVGVRPVFHLPCSVRCRRTQETAEAIKVMAKDAGYEEEIEEIYHILRWPVRFSSLHSIAEITTPVFKIRRETDEDLYERSINYLGKDYPAYGASGIRFPFKNDRKLIPILEKDMWSANGFRTRLDMERAHEIILKSLESEISRERPYSVIDLGCGNGELLRRICKAYPNVTATGVDVSVAKLEEAKRLVPGLFGKVADVTRMAFDQTYDLGIISRNRIEEANRSGIEHFQANVERFCKRLLIYSYEDMSCSIQ